jgi:hypothetical protein
MVKQNFGHICSLGNMAASLNNLSLCCPQAHDCSPMQFKLLLHGEMIIPQGKQGLSCSLGQLKLLLPGDMIVP